MALWVPRCADDAKLSEGGCPSRNRAADEHRKPSHGINWRTSPVRLINRDTSVDAFGYVRGEVPPADELARFF